MTDIEKMAREAGLPDALTAHPGVKQYGRLVAQAAARRCAEICEKQRSLFVRNRFGESDYETGLHDAARDDARAIRAEFGIKEEP